MGLQSSVWANSKIIFIPHDNRPISFAQTVESAEGLGFEIVVPPEHLLGNRTDSGKVEALWQWLFQEIKEGREIIYDRSAISRLLYRHALSLVERRGESALVEWRKQACWYIQGLAGASHWRRRLVQVSTLTNLENILKDYGLND